MKNWKLLVVFGLIAVLFVFAGCIAGTTTPEGEETPEETPEATATPEPTPALNEPIEITSGLGVLVDGYLNSTEADSDMVISGTAPAGSIVKVYIVPVDEEDGGGVVSASAETSVTGNWSVTIASAELKKLTDGDYELYAGFGDDDTPMSEKTTFTVDFTAPIIESSVGYAGKDDTNVFSDFAITPASVVEGISFADTTYDGGEWEFQVVDLDDNGITDVVIRNVDTNAELKVYNANDSLRTITLPDSDIEVEVKFRSGLVGNEEDITLRITPGTEGTDAAPAFLKVVFSEEVSFVGAEWWEAWKVYVYDIPGYNEEVDFFPVKEKASINLLQNWSPYMPRSEWWFVETRFLGTPPSSTECRDGAQYSFTVPWDKVEDVAGNNAENTLYTQGTFVASP